MITWGSMIRVATLVLAVGCFGIAQELPARESLARHCYSKAFLSVSALTRNRNTVPRVSLSLTDPLGRKQGEGLRGAEIPKSSYGQVVQVLSSPQHSRAIAIEICGAVQGEYLLTVKEQDTEPYVVDLTAWDQETDSESLLLHHLAQYGETRKYRFIFKVEKKQAVVKWIDKSGQEVMEVEPNEW